VHEPHSRPAPDQAPTLPGGHDAKSDARAEPAPAAPAALLIRLPNHLGDTLMCLPALDRLAQAGYRLDLLGKPWAAALLAAHGWRVHTAANDLHRSFKQWRALRAATGAERALLLTHSFGTAVAARLAQLVVIGYATAGRSPWLDFPVAVPARWRGDMHTVEYYDALVAAVLGVGPRQAPPLSLRIEPRATQAARALLAGARVEAPYVVLCPGATGRHRGREKTWGGFAPLTAWLLARGQRVVALPGPGEQASFEQALPGATILPQTDVAAFGALLAASRLVVANDSGPSHLAAAVGARLITLFGVTEVEKTRPWSDRATVLGSGAGWPSFDAVVAAVDRAIARAPASSN